MSEAPQEWVNNKKIIEISVSKSCSNTKKITAIALWFLDCTYYCTREMTWNMYNQKTVRDNKNLVDSTHCNEAYINKFWVNDMSK